MITLLSAQSKKLKTILEVKTIADNYFEKIEATSAKSVESSIEQMIGGPLQTSRLEEDEKTAESSCNQMTEEVIKTTALKNLLKQEKDLLKTYLQFIRNQIQYVAK